MKPCKICNQEKSLKEFPAGKGNAGGRGPVCKICRYKRSKELIKDVDAFKENNRRRARKSWNKNKDTPEAQAKLPAKYEQVRKWQEENKDYVKEQKRGYYLENQAEFAQKSQERYEANKESILQKAREDYQNPEVKARKNVQQKERRRIDPIFAMKNNMRSRLSMAVRDYIDCKKNSQVGYLGCDWETFVKHIESKFKDGMAWDNYGKKGWHIDEVIPCAAWDFNNPDHMKACWHWSNRQPMWAKDNMSKNGPRNKKTKELWHDAVEQHLQALRDAGVLPPADLTIHTSTF